MADTLHELAEKTCEPCRGGVPSLSGAPLADLHARLGNGWQLVEEHHLFKAFTFPDFKKALAFINRTGAIAEEHNHHPDLGLSWGKAEVTLFTHEIGGLTETDFVLAAKFETAYQNAM